MPILAKKKIIFSDEGHFDIGEHVSKQNYCIWGTENPHAYIEKPTHSKRVTVWCGFWSRGIIGISFFENKQKDAVTVNGNRYRTMLNELATFDVNRMALNVTQPKLHSMFCVLSLKIALSVAELMSFDVDTLKDNIRRAIGEIQLHTIDNVLKNWTDRVGYCIASTGSQ